MDTLSKILDLLHFKGTFYFATNFNAPWSIRVPNYKNVSRFHYVTQGHCWVRIGNEAKAQKLSTGDLILIPHGANHILSDLPDSEPISLDAAFNQANYSGQGIFQFGENVTFNDTQLICGHYEFDQEYSHPLIEHLPEYIIRNENEGADFSWLKDTLRFMSTVSKTEKPGDHAIFKRLSEIIFIQTVRYWYENNSKDEGFMAALNDSQISKGLIAFHEDYASNWTVEKLAQKAFMSRSLFSNKFKQYLKISPMQYVIHWRTLNAKRMLIETELSMEQIANNIGYESSAAFNKAFKKTTHASPGEYRRTNKQAAQTHLHA